MGKLKFKIGTDDFKELLDQGGYFVDKTPLISAVLDGSKITLLPRPRRFGKTLAISMLRYFFEKSPEDRRHLFTPFAVAQDPAAMAHFAQYPVIHLSLKDIRADNWNDAYEKLKKKLGALLRRHQEVLPTLAEAPRLAFERIMTETGSRSDLESCLCDLITCLHAFHRQPVVLLLDEYDTPMIKAWENGYYTEMAGFMREWLGAALKHENGPALFRAVLTGILRVAKESIFSGLNNLKVYSVVSAGPFAASFGFTEAEVDRIASDFGQTGQREAWRQWYNGHVSGGQAVYNPWSIINAVMDYPEPLSPYWINTADPALIHELMQRGGLPIRRDLERLLAGGELRRQVLDTITFQDLRTHPSAELIWTFLCYSGYLRVDDPQRDPDNAKLLTYRLTIPNLEIAVAYEQFIQRVYCSPRDGNGLEEFIACFRDDQALTKLEPLLNRLMGTLVSAFDPAYQPEAFYHAFVLGLLASLRDAYEIISNGEAGYGRADLRLRPLKPHHRPLAFIIEFKVAESAGELDAAAQAALAQIETRDYATGLVKAGVPAANIRKLALAFAERRVRVRRG